MSHRVGLYGVRMGKQQKGAGDRTERLSDGPCSGLALMESLWRVREGLETKN